MSTPDAHANRHRTLLVLASAAVTLAAGVTVGALTGYIHPPASRASSATAPAESRTVLVPIRPETTGPLPSDETAQLIAAGSEMPRGRREHDDDGHRRSKHERHHDDD